MNSKILIAGVACLSLVAMAQSTSSSKPNSTKGSAHASSAKANNPAGSSADRESSTPSVSEVTLKARAHGRESSSPSVSEAVVKAPSNGQTHVIAGDVNGDGHADLAATGSSNDHGQKTNTVQVQSPRDIASGQASGKRQHKPVQVRKEIDAAGPKR